MKTFAFALAAAGLAVSAHAHDDATLDAMAAPQGGQLRMAGAYHLELVVARDNKEAREAPVLLYLSDHAGNKVPSKGVGATVALLAGKQRATVALMPDGDNRLKGVARYISDPAMKAVVTLKLPDGSGEQARFTPLAKAP